MAGFIVNPVEGVTSEPWIDPPAPDKPSRINPVIDVGHRRWVGKVGTRIVLAALVPELGESPPEDSVLDSKPFRAWVAESPRVAFLVGPLDRSSLQAFTPPRPGHYVIGIRREGNGAVLVHLDVLRA